MAIAQEVALFVDLENIVTSLWKGHQQSPDPIKWVEKVRSYGPMSFARAYADFSQAAFGALQSRLSVAGIDAFSCPAKMRDTGLQSTVDLNVAIDLFEVALDRPAIGTFVLMAGDRDYIRIVTRLKHRLGKRIIVAGVPGSVSRDLVLAAGEEDPIETAEPLTPMGDERVIRVIDRYESELRLGIYPTFTTMERYVRHPVNWEAIPETLVHGKLNEFVQSGILVQDMVALPEGGEIRRTRLNRDHPLVQAALLPAGVLEPEPAE